MKDGYRRMVAGAGFIMFLSCAAAGASDTLIIGDTTESTTGGFKFPDGTIQTTAATGSSSGINLISPDESITVGGTTTAPTVEINFTQLDLLYAPASGSANYAPASGSPNYVATSGDSMTGDLTVNGTVRATSLVTGDPAPWGDPSGLFLAKGLSDYGGVTIAQPAWMSSSSVSLNFTVDEANNIGAKVKFYRTGNWDQGDLTFWTAPVHNNGGDYTQERMRIMSNGNVGIGTTSPTTKLDVAGSARVTGGLTANSSSSHGLQVTATGSGAVHGVYSYSTGLSRAGVFEINNPSNGGEAVLAKTNGSGQAVHGQTTGTGSAGTFDINNAANNSDALYVLTNGTGKAGYFQINNPASNSHALYVTTNGTGVGYGIYSYSTGLSRAGVFEINNGSNGGEAVLAKTNGSGSAVYGATTGTGNAGAFSVSNAASNADALYVSTNGTGNAGNFNGKVNVTGNLTVTGTGAMPVYNPSGTARNAPHMVTGKVVADSSGTSSVSLTGPASFSSVDSYTCTGAMVTGISPPSAVGVEYVGSSSFNLYSAPSATISYICVGT